MKIYIAGPITTNLENWQKCFSSAEDYLYNKYPTAQIVNPLTLENQPECAEAREMYEEGSEELWSWMLRHDICELMHCSHIYLLKGWENSRGARLELRTALDVGIKPIFEI